MKVILDGKELKCFSFAELKAGDVFTYQHGAAAYIKTPQNTAFNMCSGMVENYSGQPVIPYPDATLVLDPLEMCDTEDMCEACD